MPAEDLNKSIENGEFFREARQWYMYKYIFPVIERSMLIAVSIASVITAIVSISIVLETLPTLNRKVPVAITIKDTDKSNYIYIYPLQKPEDKENPNVAVGRYLVAKFVEMYERYDAMKPQETIDANWHFMERFADDNTKLKYKNYVLEDAKSLTNRLTRYASRVAKIDITKLRENVVITPTTHLGNNDGYDYFTAKIPFKVTETLVRASPDFKTDNLNYEIELSAEIEFKMKPVEYYLYDDEKTGKSYYKFKDVDLIVTSYNTSEVPIEAQKTEASQTGISEDKQPLTEENEVIDNSTKVPDEEVKTRASVPEENGQTLEILPDNDNNKTKAEESIIIEQDSQQTAPAETGAETIQQPAPEQAVEMPTEQNGAEQSEGQQNAQ